jgi:hypothetical protein
MTGWLPGLLVEGVLPIPAAVLAHLDALAIVLLVLARYVVAPFANITRQRHLHSSFVFGHLELLPFPACNTGAQ